jgi:hypothetical protein
MGNIRNERKNQLTTTDSTHELLNFIKRRLHLYFASSSHSLHCSLMHLASSAKSSSNSSDFLHPQNQTPYSNQTPHQHHYHHH